MVTFVNDFDITVRSKLSTFQGKLTKLERAIDVCESAINTSTLAIDGNKDAEKGYVEGEYVDQGQNYEVEEDEED